MNKLTDHTLGMRDITPELSIVYINTFATDIELISGNRLILSLLRNPNNHTTFISYNNKGWNDHLAGINNTSSVRIDPNTKEKMMVMNPLTESADWDKVNAPIEINIAHELIHAHRFMRGVNFRHDELANWEYQRKKLFGFRIATDIDIPKEELATIGLEFHTDGDITENMIRTEQKLWQRWSHLR
jgi:hypothetical protein